MSIVKFSFISGMFYNRCIYFNNQFYSIILFLAILIKSLSFIDSFHYQLIIIRTKATSVFRLFKFSSKSVLKPVNEAWAFGY